MYRYVPSDAAWQQAVPKDVSLNHHHLKTYAVLQNQPRIITKMRFHLLVFCCKYNMLVGDQCYWKLLRLSV